MYACMHVNILQACTVTVIVCILTHYCVRHTLYRDTYTPASCSAYMCMELNDVVCVYIHYLYTPVAGCQLLIIKSIIVLLTPPAPP